MLVDLSDRLVINTVQPISHPEPRTQTLTLVQELYIENDYLNPRAIVFGNWNLVYGN